MIMTSTIFLAIVAILAVAGLISLVLGKQYYYKTSSLKIVDLGFGLLYVDMLFIIIICVCILFGWIELIQ